MVSITNTSVSRRVGNFDWAHPKDEQSQILVRFTLDGESHSITDLVEPNSQFDYDGDDISEAVDAIDNAIDRYWISTSREKTKETIAIFRANEDAIRKAHASYLAKYWQRRSSEAAKKARQYLDEACEELEASL